MINALSNNQTISFPFSTMKIRIKISGIRKKTPGRAYIIAINSEEPLSELPWSDALNSYFVYMPELLPKNDVEFEAFLGNTVRSLTFRIQPWSPHALELEQSFSKVNIVASGVAGEERREYQMDYEYSGE